MVIDRGTVIREELRAATTDVGGVHSTHTIGCDDDLGALSQSTLGIAKALTGRAMSPVILAGFVRFFEWCTIALTGLGLFVVYLGGEYGVSPFYLSAIALASTLAVILFQLLGLYTPYGLRSLRHHALRLAGGWMLVFGALLVLGFFSNLGDDLSRLWVGLWFTIGFLLLLGYRGLVMGLMNRWTAAGRLQRTAALVGSGPDAERLVEALGSDPFNDVKLVGFFDDRGTARSDETCAGLPKLGSVDDAIAFARIAHLDMMIVTLPVTAEKRVVDMVRKLWVLPIDVRLSAHTAKLRFRPRAYNYIGAVPFLAIFDRPLADWDYVAKALLDRVLGFAMLVALSPLMLLTALAVKLDSKGPVLFKQKRFGFNNEPIDVYKFRSMFTDQCDANAVKVVTRNDSRVTRVGAFIRKTSIDELPQLFNVVFKGDLSLVGPRPHAMKGHLRGTPFDKVIDGYFARHRVKPGITGWAQVNGWRGEMDTMEKFEQRVEHDLYYIENWSILFDLQIIATTPLSLLTKNENAY